MAFDEPDGKDLKFTLGRMMGRIEALETRADQQEKTLIGMDGKLDEIQRSLAASSGGRDQMASLAKYGFAFLSAIGAAGGVIVGIFHFLAGKP